MTDLKYSNYGLPDEVAYPHRADSIIMRSVQVVHHEPAETSVHKIRNMAGRPAAVLHTYDVWSDAANNLVGGSTSILTRTLSNLGGWWEGSAYVAFTNYMAGENGPVQASKSNAAHMMNVCKQLLQAYGGIIDTYNQSVQKMADVATMLNKYAPWKIQNMFRDTDNVMNILTDFANNITKWEIERRNAIKAYVENSKQVMSEIQAVVPPNDFPSSALIPKKWDVKYD